MRLLLALLAGSALFAGDYPRITFEKTFKGAVPPYYQIQVQRDGSCVYKEAPNDEQPVSFKVDAAAVGELFGRFEKLGNGTKPLESNLKVANMGAKVLRFEDGKDRHEVAYNYSVDPDAQAITDFFEKISETQQHFFLLERVVRFDKLGVNKVLLQIETLYDRQRLVGYENMLPLLDRVAKNESYLNMARERAARLAWVLRNPKPNGSGQEAGASK